jgi:predicted permease
MVLVSMASVLLGTFVRLQALPSGVEPKQLTVFQVALKGDHYANTRTTTQFVTAVLGQLEHLPGVDRVAAVNGLPLDRGLNMGGSPADRPNLKQIIEFRAVTPGYFQTMGISLLAGRDIAESDRADGDRVVLIGAAAAKKWWPGRSPIGEMIRLGGNNIRCRIVGVVADVQMHSLVESDGIAIYGPMTQIDDKFMAMINGWFPTTFAVRTAAHLNLAEPIEKAVAQADAEIPVTRMTTMQSVIDDSIQAPRFFSVLATCFSAFALVLTVIGMFGLMSYQVTQRTREIGVRMALGATRGAILRQFLERGLMLASAGVVLGLAMSWWMRPVLSHLLSDAGIDPADEMSAAASHVIMNGVEGALLALIVVLAASVLASWMPARRAASIEPMNALRTE